eukprot:1560091-Prymnesium_polylepis.1
MLPELGQGSARLSVLLCAMADAPLQGGLEPVSDEELQPDSGFDGTWHADGTRVGDARVCYVRVDAGARVWSVRHGPSAWAWHAD